MTRDLVKLAKTLGPGRVAEIAKLRAENEQLRSDEAFFKLIEQRDAAWNENIRLMDERVRLLALLKAAREHHCRCRYELTTLDEDPPIPERDAPKEEREAWMAFSEAIDESCDLGPPLEDCKEIETL